MLTIRLQRTGRRNAADFRIVVAEKTAHVSKKVQEILGNYNPHKKNFNIRNTERLQQLLAQNVELSPTMHNLLVDKGLLKADKVKAFNVPKKEQPKAEAAAPATSEAPAPSAEAPVAEAPAPETPADSTTETQA